MELNELIRKTLTEQTTVPNMEQKLKDQKDEEKNFDYDVPDVSKILGDLDADISQLKELRAKHKKINKENGDEQDEEEEQMQEQGGEICCCGNIHCGIGPMQRIQG